MSNEEVMDESSSSVEERIKAWLSQCDLAAFFAAIPPESKRRLGVVQEDRNGDKRLVAEFDAEPFFKDLSELVGFKSIAEEVEETKENE